MATIEKRRTEKQRIREVLMNLNRFYPKFALQRFGDRIQSVWNANQQENPEAAKMLDDLLATLQKSKTAKAKESTQEDMPADFGWEKTPEEIKAEERLAKRTGQVEKVIVTGTVAPPDAGVPPSVAPKAPAKPGK